MTLKSLVFYCCDLPLGPAVQFGGGSIVISASSFWIRFAEVLSTLLNCFLATDCLTVAGLIRAWLALDEEVGWIGVVVVDEAGPDGLVSLVSRVVADAADILIS